MNIYEISEKFSLSITKLKRMQKAGVLVCSGAEGHPLAAAMRTYLSNKQPLTVQQLLILIRKPEVIAELRGKQSDARLQLEALGDWQVDKPAGKMLVTIQDASGGSEEALGSFMRWIKLVVPNDPVSYHWLAVRAMQAITDENTCYEFQFKFAKALEFARKSPDFDGWYRSEQIGSRKRMVYFNPIPKKFIDVYDL